MAEKKTIKMASPKPWQVRGLAAVIPLFVLSGLLLVIVLHVRQLPEVVRDDERQSTPFLPQVAQGQMSDAEKGLDQKAVSTRATLISPVALWPVTVPSTIDQLPAPERAHHDFLRLLRLPISEHDYFETAVTLGNQASGSRTIQRDGYVLGDKIGVNTPGGERFVELVFISQNAYLWSETGLRLDPLVLAGIGERLDTKLLPGLRADFGREWSPGIDGDARISIIHLNGAAELDELGYFSARNEYPATLFSESNEQEMIFLNMSQMEAKSDVYYGTLVHELQHLIQWHMDSNETVWLNEGLAQLAETMMGLNTINPVAYLERPHTRLNTWQKSRPIIHAHYAGSYLFLNYLWEQAGEQAIRELARHPANGMAAINAILAAYLPHRTLGSFVADWAVANYLIEGGITRTSSYPTGENPLPFIASRAVRLPYDSLRSLGQFAVEYIELDMEGAVGITFAGDTVARLTDGPPPDGDLFWFAPPADNSRAILESTVDLTNLSAASLTFDSWYDLEEGWDFAYVSVSADGGNSWEIVLPQHISNGQFGPAMGGRSGALAGSQKGWVPERVDLKKYAGQIVTLRIEVLTDAETLGRGFALAHGRIPEQEQSDSALVWQPEGFVETGWTLPQEWQVRIITKGQSPSVQEIGLDENNQGQKIVTLGPEGGVVMVIPTTPFVDEQAQYWVEFREP